MRPGARGALFGGALAVSLAVAALVFRGRTSFWLDVAWLLSLVAFAAAARLPLPAREPRGRARGILLVLAVSLLPVAVRIANFDPNRLHTDELLTAYFSATENFHHSEILDHRDAARPGFFGYMPETWEWQAQFPKPFFLLQRGFFALAGESLTTARLSVQIYVALVAAALFLILREILDPFSALAGVVLYSFLGVSVYFETLGVMFISSTAALTVFFYLALKEYRTGEIRYAALAGIACGFCYLTYYTSYLALPLLAAIAGTSLLSRRRPAAVLQNLAIALAGMLLVLAPFLAYIVRNGNYLTARVNQLGLLSGEWSQHREEIQHGASRLPIVAANLALALSSFVRNGIGGGGGYDFGHLALLDGLSVALLAIGAAAAVVLAARGRAEWLFVLGIVVASFAAFVVLVLPPPGYHRFLIANPFLVLLMVLPLSLLLRAGSLPRSVRLALAGGLLLVFACVNERRLVEALWLDRPTDEIRLARYVAHRYPGRAVYVAAYGGFGYSKVLYFFLRNPPPLAVETRDHEGLLNEFRRGEKYVYLITFPDEFDSKFRAADPAGRLFRFSKHWSVFAN